MSLSETDLLARRHSFRLWGFFCRFGAACARCTTRLWFRRILHLGCRSSWGLFRRLWGRFGLRIARRAFHATTPGPTNTTTRLRVIIVTFRSCLNRLGSAIVQLACFINDGHVFDERLWAVLFDILTWLLRLGSTLMALRTITTLWPLRTLGTLSAIRTLTALVLALRLCCSFLLCLITFATSGMSRRLALWLCGSNDAKIMLGMLEIVLRHDPIAGCLGIASKLLVLFCDMQSRAANFDVRTVRFVGPA